MAKAARGRPKQCAGRGVKQEENARAGRFRGPAARGALALQANKASRERLGASHERWTAYFLCASSGRKQPRRPSLLSATDPLEREVISEHLVSYDRRAVLSKLFEPAEARGVGNPRKADREASRPDASQSAATALALVPAFQSCPRARPETENRSKTEMRGPNGRVARRQRASTDIPSRRAPDACVQVAQAACLLEHLKVVTRW